MANEHKSSTTSEALRAAGDQRLADDVQGLEVMAAEVDRKLGRTTASLAERLIFWFGPIFRQPNAFGYEPKHPTQPIVRPTRIPI